MLLGTAINGRYFEKYLFQKSVDNMLRNSDVKVYGLQLKQKSNGILRNFRTAIFEDNFLGLLLKRKQKRRKACSDLCGLRFSHFPRQLFIKS